MHWEFANGTWAAKYQGQVWGIQAAKDGTFLVINPDGDVLETAHTLSTAKSCAERRVRRLQYTSSDLEAKAKAFVADMTAEEFQEYQIFSADVAFTLVMEQTLRASREAKVVASVTEGEER